MLVAGADLRLAGSTCQPRRGVPLLHWPHGCPRAARPGSDISIRCASACAFTNKEAGCSIFTGLSPLIYPP